GALNIALDSPPYGPNLDEAKPEISKVFKSLSRGAQDTLMKYIYKDMGMPGRGNVISGSVLLAWYLTEVAGTSCIVRVTSDRRTV
ncbi:actin-related protein 2/3 complex subunit 5, partial [Pisolithus albus]